MSISKVLFISGIISVTFASVSARDMVEEIDTVVYDQIVLNLQPG